MRELKQMAKDVSMLQSEMENQDESTRDRVLRMGRALRKMQKLQKLEQKADIEAGNTPVTWNEWLEGQKVTESHFPHDSQCRRYALISKYPGAYKKGMSINEGYRQAGIWKSHGGNPPITEKKTSTNPLILVSHKASPFQRKVRVINDMIAASDIIAVAEDMNWDEDILEGCRRLVQETIKEAQILMNHLNQLEFKDV